MDLSLNTVLASKFSSPSQRARVLTEDWFERNMYCPNCPNTSLRKSPNNLMVVDFQCERCGSEYQVKSKKGTLGRKLRDAAFQPMMDRILANRSPHFAFLQYNSTEWTVDALLLVPGHFITTSVIERCAPLSVSARRAGWVGCNILAEAIPSDGRLLAIHDRVALPPHEVRRQWAKFIWLASKPAQTRGWTTELLRRVRNFRGREFALDELYEFEPELSCQFPNNRNIRPKIRQQLQVLRDRGIIQFLGKSTYRAI
jgi:type II restriction enzyme